LPLESAIMGHIRLGRLPRTISWKRVLESFSNSDTSLNEIVQLTAIASQKVLTNSKYIEGLTHCFWLFTNIAKASRNENFADSLNNLGISVSDKDSRLNILKKIYDSASTSLRESGKFSILDQIAMDSFKSAFHNTITQESSTLFGCDIDTIQRAFKKYSTSTQVSKLGREFFSQYMYKSFSFVLEKELANKISATGRFQNSKDIENFNRNLKTYCWEASKIVEDFSGGWYGKHSFEGDLVNKKQTYKFTHHAMTKLLSEISREVS